MTQIGAGPDIANCSTLLLAIDLETMLLSGRQAATARAIKYEAEIHENSGRQRANWD